VQSYENKRRVEVLAVLRGLDGEMAALIEEARVSREGNGFVLYDALPTALRSRESLERETRRTVLAEKRNVALREFCTLQGKFAARVVPVGARGS
jgi:hypothetical protein